MKLNKDIDFMNVVLDVVINKKNFIDYLLFLREEYRIQRGL
jgi:hypothetical protein